MTTRNAANNAAIDSAYAASASSGDIINLTGTTYGDYESPTGTKAVTIQGAGPATTKFGMLIAASSNATWKDLAATTVVSDPYWYVGTVQMVHPTNVTLDTVTIDNGYATETVGGMLMPLPYRGGLLSLEGCTDWTMLNCTIGGAINSKCCNMTGTGHTFDGCLIHDNYIDNRGGNDVHLEGIWAASCSGLTLRRCTFVRCNYSGVLFTNLGGSPTTDVTIENCLFSHAHSSSSPASGDSWHVKPSGLEIGYLGVNPALGTLTNWVVRNNTFEAGVTCISRPAVNSRWVGNVGQWPSLPGMVYGHNVGTKIHATDTLVSPSASTQGSPAPFGWVSPAHPNYNFHLTAASICRDKADPADFPTTDLDGVVRT